MLTHIVVIILASTLTHSQLSDCCGDPIDGFDTFLKICDKTYA